MKKKLLVMLTRMNDRGSRIISLMPHSHYTHASIALSEDPSTFYSFSVKGFRIEKPEKSLKKGREPYHCQLYTIDVSENTYLAARALIRRFSENRETYRYSFLGICLALLHIPFRKETRYFCSQFVADILKQSGALQMRKRTCLVLPGDFQKTEALKLAYTGNLQEYLQYSLTAV